jgi:hypothetical protein
MLHIQIPCTGITGTIRLIEQSSRECTIQFVHEQRVRHARNEELTSKQDEVCTRYTISATYNPHGILADCTVQIQLVTPAPAEPYHFFGIPTNAGTRGTLCVYFIHRDKLYAQSIKLQETTYERDEMRTFLGAHPEIHILPTIEREVKGYPIRCSLQECSTSKQESETFYVPIQVRQAVLG